MLDVSVRVTKNADAAGALRDGLDAYMMDGATVGFNASQEIVAAEATDRGTLLQSGQPPARQSDGSVVWGYAAPYAEAVNDGSRPHTAPVRPLLEWADRVIGTQSDPSTSEVLGRIQNKDWGPDLFRHAGLAVWSKIRAKGTRGVHFAERAERRMQAWFQARDIGPYLEVRL